LLKKEKKLHQRHGGCGANIYHVDDQMFDGRVVGGAKEKKKEKKK
jgi:hypothetical protein